MRAASLALAWTVVGRAFEGIDRLLGRAHEAVDGLAGLLDALLGEVAHFRREFRSLGSGSLPWAAPVVRHLCSAISHCALQNQLSLCLRLLRLPQSKRIQVFRLACLAADISLEAQSDMTPGYRQQGPLMTGGPDPFEALIARLAAEAGPGACSPSRARSCSSGIGAGRGCSGHRRRPRGCGRPSPMRPDGCPGFPGPRAHQGSGRRACSPEGCGWSACGSIRPAPGFRLPAPAAWHPSTMAKRFW